MSIDSALRQILLGSASIEPHKQRQEQFDPFNSSAEDDKYKFRIVTKSTSAGQNDDAESERANKSTFKMNRQISKVKQCFENYRMKKKDNRCRLLEMPTEIRLLIYQQVFAMEIPSTKAKSILKNFSKRKPLYIVTDGDKCLPPVWFLGQVHGISLLRTCQQIRRESLTVWNKFQQSDKRTHVYPLLRPQKWTRCKKCPKRLPWNRTIRCDDCNREWSDYLCKKHIRPLTILTALAYCPVCQCNALLLSRRKPWYLNIENGRHLYLWRPGSKEALKEMIQESQSFEDISKGITNFVRVSVKYTHSRSLQDAYTSFQEVFMVWRQEVLDSLRSL